MDLSFQNLRTELAKRFPPWWSDSKSNNGVVGSTAILTAGGGSSGGKHPKPTIHDFDDGDDNSVQAHWALLVAGSAGWGK